jgi:hypothetical protein
MKLQESSDISELPPKRPQGRCQPLKVHREVDNLPGESVFSDSEQKANIHVVRGSHSGTD